MSKNGTFSKLATIERNISTDFMRFSVDQIQRAQSDADDMWTFANSILYRMCEENPEHKDVGIVAGKLLIIGRTYAAAVERGKTQPDKERVSADDKYKSIAAEMIKSNLDVEIQHVREHGEFSREGLRVTLDAHHNLTKLFQSSTSQRKRSLASKYLHFHAPEWVPIYDSIASGELFRLMRGHSFTAQMDGKFDTEYERFSRLLIDLREEIKNQHRDGAGLTPRQLDRLLLQCAADRKTKKQQNRL